MEETELGDIIVLVDKVNVSNSDESGIHTAKRQDPSELCDNQDRLAVVEGSDNLGDSTSDNDDQSSGNNDLLEEELRVRVGQRRKLSRMEVEALQEKTRRAHLSALWNIFDNRLLGMDSPSPTFSQHQLISIISELNTTQHLFGLFDPNSVGYLTQDEWIEQLKTKIRTPQQLDLLQLFETAAYLVCGEGTVQRHHFHSIINAKGVAVKLVKVLQESAGGCITSSHIMEFISRLSDSTPSTSFTKENLEWLERMFRAQVGNAQELRLQDFKKIVHSKNVFFAKRVFQIFDRDGSGSVSLQEFMDAMHRFAGQSHEDKIQFLFRVYDLDGDGLIQHLELQHVIHACMDENGMQFSDEQIEDLTWALFEDADVEGRGAITYEALKAQLEKHDGLLENLSTSIDRWLVPVKPKDDSGSLWTRIAALKPYQFSLPYIKNNYTFLMFMTVFLLVNAALFIQRIVHFWHANPFYILARACGQCLNFNCAFLLVVMLRNLMTYARTHGLGSYLPLDQHIYFHKMAGWFVFVYSCLHTLGHLLYLTTDVIHQTYTNGINSGQFSVAEWLFTNRPGMFGTITGLANPSGVVMLLLLVVIVICSQPFVRKTGNFEVFYRTHLLYVPFLLLGLLHAPNFWKWMVAPGVLYIFERIVRLVRARTGHGKTYISSGILLPSKVTHLVIKRPNRLDFHPGDYLFVNVPAIAKYEWHPFTISSAPEQDDTLWLHIRAVGGWTHRLYDYFEEQQTRLENTLDKSRTTADLSPDSNPSEPRSRPLFSRSRIRRQQALSLRKSSPQPSLGAQPANSCLRRISFEDDVVSGSSQGATNQAFCQDSQVAMKPIGDVVIDVNTPTTNEQNPDSERNIQAFSESGGRQRKSGVSTAFTSQPRHSEPNDRCRSVPPRATLQKTKSLPDMEQRLKKRQLLMHLRETSRSTSEHKFSEVSLQEARNLANQLSYNMSPWMSNPKNKSVAKSFRYMRRKPTIIAFKTPSSGSLELENVQETRRKNTPTSGVLKLLKTHAEEALVTADTPASPDNNNVKDDYAVIGKPLEVFLDGPYGAPSSHIFRAQHAVLIGTGIGVTPFASILQSIMHRYWNNRHQCPSCQYCWTDKLPESVMNLKKVDFFWINRDQRSFEWFVSLLSQLEIEQAELGGVMDRFLDMHMYITSALQKTDMKAVGLQLALDLLHEKERRDMITGLKTRTIAGRPNWNKVFRKIQQQHKGKVTVFFCGAPQLSRVLRYKCDEFGFEFRKENF